MENKVVLITGTSSGFGYLTVKSTAKMGLTVYAGMRNIEGKNKPKADELTEFAKMNNLKINPVEMDVTDEKSVDDAVKSIMSTERTIDILINNAGVSCGGWTEAFTAEQFYKVLDVNLMGVHRVNRTVLPFMRKQNSGLIIYISSICGRMIIPFMGPYNASKFAVEGLAESYSCELSGFGIKSVIIEPSVFQTNVGKNMLYSDDIERLNTFEDKLNEPEEFFNGFFSSDNNVAAGFSLRDEETNPQKVADVICGIIKRSDEKLPLRVVVDYDPIEKKAVEELNIMSGKIFDKMLKNII